MDELTSRITREDMTFEEAAKHFKGRVPVTPKEFYRLKAKYRTLAFTVSNYTKAQVLNKFYEEVLAGLEEGNTVQEFRANMNDFLQEKGYKGLTPFQADTIFRTNTQTAYNVGHYEQMNDPDVKALRPYWQYDAVGDAHTRPSHLAMDGKVFPADSPVWDIWFPPNGFRCRCSVRSLSKRQVEARGLTVEETTPDRVELADGRVVSIRPDPKFAYNPAKVAFEPDMAGYPASIVKAYQKREQEGKDNQ